MPPVQYRIVSTRTIKFSEGGDGVAVPSPQYVEMASRWELINDLLGGTDVMRAKGERWLPRNQHETMANYRARLARSFLYNGLSDTVERLSSLPFSQPVTVKPEPKSKVAPAPAVPTPEPEPEVSPGGDPVPTPLPPRAPEPVPAEPEQQFDERLDSLQEDVDGSGTNLTQLCNDLFEDAAAYGKAHVYTDMPSAEPAANLAEEREQGRRPLMMRVHPRDVIGWRGERLPGGEERVSLLRMVEKRWEPEGKYGQKQVTYVRVVTAPAGPGAKGTYELWKCGERSTDKVESGVHDFPGVPIRTVYFKRTGFMEARPPMQALAEMNLLHWQSSSDHRNCLLFSRFGMVKATGISQDEMEKPMTLGPMYSFRSVNPDADFGYVETAGVAIKLGEEDLGKIEGRMEVLGRAPLDETTADSTAAGKKIDDRKKDSKAQSWVRALETCVEGAYEDAATWLGIDLPEDFSVDIFDDFALSVGADTDSEFLLKCRVAGEIRRETFLREIRRRGVVSDDVDPAQEAATAEAEASSMAAEQLNNDLAIQEARGGPPGGFGG